MKKTAKPREGLCGARLRGKDAGKFCGDDPAKGRTRCRIHGGASPRAAAHPRFVHGLRSAGALGLGWLTNAFEDTEQRLIERFRRNPEEALRLQLAEASVVQRRAQRAGNVDAYTRLGTMIATTARALVSLHEVPPPERGLPKLIEVFQGKRPEDFERDLEITRREASVGVE